MEQSILQNINKNSREISWQLVSQTRGCDTNRSGTKTVKEFSSRTTRMTMCLPKAAPLRGNITGYILQRVYILQL